MNRTISLDNRGYAFIGKELEDGKRYQMFIHNLFVFGIDYYIKNLDILVDHKNGNRLDNRLINLRPANEFQNTQNAKIRKDNSCGIKGFTVQVPSNRPTAHILVRIQAYKTRLKKYFVFNMNGLKKAIIWDYNTRQQLHNDFTNYGFDIKNKTIEEIIDEQSQIFINNLTEYQLKVFNNNGIVYQRKKGTFNVG